MDFKQTLAILLMAWGLRIFLLAEVQGRGAPTSRSPFIAVFIDRQTELKLGAFPYDRSILAAAVRRSADLGAKGVVLKFFLDLPRSTVGDGELAEAMKSTPVLLQAGDGNGSSAVLPERFKLTLPAGVLAFRSSGGGIPLTAFLTSARDVGFVDNISQDRLPAIERFGDGYVKSLYVECLELATGQRAQVTPGVSIQFGEKGLTLDSRNQLTWKMPARDDLNYVSFADFLGGSDRTDVRDRVVVIGYDGDQSPIVSTPIGPVKVHRLFHYALLSLNSSLAPMVRN